VKLHWERGCLNVSDKFLDQLRTISCIQDPVSTPGFPAKQFLNKGKPSNLSGADQPVAEVTSGGDPPCDTSQAGTAQIWPSSWQVSEVVLHAHSHSQLVTG